MFASNDFNAFDARYPLRFPKPTIENVPAENEQQSLTSQLYAAAWAQAQRDYELDRLFNADFYQAGDI